jgi:hypothetical protein
MTHVGEAGRVSELRRLAFEAVTGFDGGFGELERLLARVKAVLSELETISDARWIVESRRQWGQLEILYALVLESARVALTDEEDADAKEIVSRLEGLLRP